MNIEYLEQARERVPNIPLLINMISRRVRQLNAGQRPLIKPDKPTQPHLRVQSTGDLARELVKQQTRKHEAKQRLKLADNFLSSIPSQDIRTTTSCDWKVILSF